MAPASVIDVGSTTVVPAPRLVTHSNRVSSNRGLRCRETEFSRQRQRGRNGFQGSRTPLQRQNLAKQPRPFGGYSARTGKSPLDRECVVADAVGIEPSLLSKFPGWSQGIDATLYLGRRDGVDAMERGYVRGFDAVAKAELWERWRRGESLKAIGRAFGKPSSSINFQVTPHGGTRPA